MTVKMYLEQQLAYEREKAIECIDNGDFDGAKFHEDMYNEVLEELTMLMNS